MKRPSHFLRSVDPRPIPPLSQSRHGDMACEALYVHKHVRGAITAKSEAAARGTEIHEILATYLNHLVGARRSTDLEAFDALMKRAGVEAILILDEWFKAHPDEQRLRDKLTISSLSSALKAERRAELADKLTDIAAVRVDTELRMGPATKVKQLVATRSTFWHSR